ncbi:MAG: hypothetical protein NXY57DRAFT_77986 [Lentinula lateritia]|nr:MAG: hypothetical protein NXY57DRAFT_77986 [Lentinula lateritia]
MSSALFTAITTTLKGDNYDTWISEMDTFLQATGLGSAITDPPVKPSPPLDTADLDSVKAWKEYDNVFKPWKEINTKAVGNIRLCLSLSICTLTKDEGDMAQKLWEFLQKTYKVNSTANWTEVYRVCISLGSICILPGLLVLSTAMLMLLLVGVIIPILSLLLLVTIVTMLLLGELGIVSLAMNIQKLVCVVRLGVANGVSTESIHNCDTNFGKH